METDRFNVYEINICVPDELIPSIALSRKFDIFLMLNQLQMPNIFKNLNYGMLMEKK